MQSVASALARGDHARVRGIRDLWHARTPAKSKCPSGARDFGSGAGSPYARAHAATRSACYRMRPRATACGRLRRLRPLAAACGRLQPVAAACNRLPPLATSCSRGGSLAAFAAEMEFSAVVCAPVSRILNMARAAHWQKRMQRLRAKLTNRRTPPSRVGVCLAAFGVSPGRLGSPFRQGWGGAVCGVRFRRLAGAAWHPFRHCRGGAPLSAAAGEAFRIPVPLQIAGPPASALAGREEAPR